MRPLAFAAEYADHFSEYARAAALAGSFVQQILEAQDVHPDLVSSRPKSPHSLRRKILEKRYNNPRRQITDLIGVRVIVLYQSDTDAVVRALSTGLQIDTRRSIDKKVILQPTQFGYRSVHLIARLRPFDAASPEFTSLRNRWFEIQVRSLLEHSWAAIEHECIYKSKIKYPTDTKRRFAAIAGSLEVLDREFGALRTAWMDLVKLHLHDFEQGHGLNEQLDTARLIAFLCHLLPEGHGWLAKPEDQRRPLSLRLASSALIGLRVAGITKASWLAKEIGHPNTRKVLRRYARISQQPISHLSHLAVTCIVVAKRRPTTFIDFFPELAEDPLLKKALLR